MPRSRMSLMTLSDTPTFTRGSSRYSGGGKQKEKSRQNGLPVSKGGLKLRNSLSPGYFGVTQPDQTPRLDPVEFPSLPNGKPALVDLSPQNPTNSYITKQNHVDGGTITNIEDFPALPQTSPGTIGHHLNKSHSSPNMNGRSGGGGGKLETEVTKGIIASRDGRITNIPSSMIADQFGMIGLISMIKLMETDRNLVALPCGYDLAEFRLDLESKGNLYPSFAGPFVDGPVRAEDVEVEIPREYNVTNPMVYPDEVVASVREKLTPLKIKNYKDDQLFYLFYSCPCDILQLLAASELYIRDWRYHKEEKVWIIKIPGVVADEKGAGFERGTYYYFDTDSWRKRDKEFHLEYDKLEGRPSIPNGYMQKYLSYAAAT